jgi:hypothetical protein
VANWASTQALYFTPEVTGQGCWVREYSGAVNVKWFGAKGDGVVDDTAAIQSFLQYCSINEKKAMFTDGVFLISKNINVNDVNKLIVVGSGASTVIKRMDGALTTTWDRGIVLNGATTTTGNSLIEIKDITWDGNEQNNPIPSGEDTYFFQRSHFVTVFSNDVLNVVVDNVTIKNPTAGGVALANNPGGVYGNIIVTRLYNNNRVRTLSDFVLVASYDSLIVSDINVPSFEIEINSFDNTKSHYTTITNSVIGYFDVISDADISDTLPKIILSSSFINSNLYINDYDVEIYNSKLILNTTVSPSNAKVKLVNCKIKANAGFSGTLGVFENVATTSAKSCYAYYFENCEFTADDSVVLPAFFYDRNAYGGYSLELEHKTEETVFKNCKFKGLSVSYSIRFRRGRFLIDNCEHICSSGGIYQDDANGDFTKTVKIFRNTLTTGGSLYRLPSLSSDQPVSIWMDYNIVPMSSKYVANYLLTRITAPYGTGSVLTLKAVDKNIQSETPPTGGGWLKGMVIHNINTNVGDPVSWIIYQGSDSAALYKVTSTVS